MKCIAVADDKRCRKNAKYFGKFAGGGLCLEHALRDAKEFGVQTFHAEFIEELQKELDKCEM